MSMHVTATRDGCRISCDDRERLPDGSGVVRFNGAAVHVPVPMMDIRGVLLNGQRAVVGSGINDQTYRVLESGDIRHISVQTSGRNAVLATPTDLYIVKAPGTHYTRNGGPDIPIPHGGTSQGLLEADANGDPIWVDDWGPAASRRYAPRDTWMVQVQTDGDFTSGTEALAEPGRYLVHRHSTDELRMAPYAGDVSFPMQVLDMGGDCLLSLSGPVLSPPASNWLRWDQLVPYAPQVEDVPVVLPELDRVPTLDRPMTFAIIAFNDSDASGLGNVFVPVRPSVPWVNRQVIVPVEDLAFYRRKDVFGLWVAEGGTRQLTLEKALEEARPFASARRCGLVAYAETFGRLFVPALRDGEVYSEPFYRDAHESTEAYKTRCQNRYEAVVESGRRFWPTIGIYSRGWVLTDLQVVESFHAVADLALRQGWPGALAFAAGRKHEDGRLDMPVVLVPHVQRFVDGLRGTVPLLVDIVPPPIDPLDPPVDDPIDPDEGDDEMPKLLTAEELDPILTRAGAVAAKMYGGRSAAEWTQGCRQAADGFRAKGIDGTPMELIEGARWREKGIDAKEVEAVMADAATVRLPRR